jgi:hypothetical protein
VELMWALSWVVPSRIQYLGIQEASRKRRPPTKTPGAWAGGVFQTSSTSICVSVSQDKWDKAKGLINSLRSEIEAGGCDCGVVNASPVKLNFKELVITRGFLVHLFMTFEILTHHLKGFHLALAAHLPGRNSEGWKLSDSDWMMYLLEKLN